MAKAPQIPGRPGENPGEVRFTELYVTPAVIRANGTFTDGIGAAFEFEFRNNYLHTRPEGDLLWTADRPEHQNILLAALNKVVKEGRYGRGEYVSIVRDLFCVTPLRSIGDEDEGQPVDVRRGHTGSGAGAVLRAPAAWEDDEPPLLWAEDDEPAAPRVPVPSTPSPTPRGSRSAVWVDDESAFSPRADDANDPDSVPSGISSVVRFDEGAFEVNEREIYVRGEIVLKDRSYGFRVLNDGIVHVMGDDYNWAPAPWARLLVQTAINQRFRESGLEGGVELEGDRLVFRLNRGSGESFDEEPVDDLPSSARAPSVLASTWKWLITDPDKPAVAPDPDAEETESRSVLASTWKWLITDPDKPAVAPDPDAEETESRSVLASTWKWLITDSAETPAGAPLAVQRGFWARVGGGALNMIRTEPGSIGQLKRVSDAEMSAYRAGVIMDRLGVDKIFDSLGTFTLGSLNVAVSFAAFMHLSAHGARAGIGFADYLKIAGYQTGNVFYGIGRGLVGKIPLAGTFLKENVLPEYRAYEKSAKLFEPALEVAIERARDAGLTEGEIEEALKEDATIKEKWKKKAEKKGKEAHGGGDGHGTDAGTHGPQSPEAAKKALVQMVAAHLMYKDVTTEELKRADPTLWATLDAEIKRVNKGHSNLNAGERQAGHALHEVMHDSKPAVDKASRAARAHFNTLMERAGLVPDPRSESTSWFNWALAHAQHHVDSVDAPAGTKAPLVDEHFLPHVVNERFGWELRRQLGGTVRSEDARNLIGRFAASPDVHKIQDLIEGPENSHNNERLGALVRAVVSGGGAGHSGH